MYFEYWGLKKQPFHNVPDPEMYFDMHQSVDKAVSEVMFAIQEGDECLAVVIGPVGVGKTMCLRVVLDTLDLNQYRVAFVGNPDLTFPQLLRAVIGQLLGRPCKETTREALLDAFNRILFETRDQGRHVVIFIDEGNVIRSHNLESLRLLTNMQDVRSNLFTMVLAGQPELGRHLEDPERAALFQRIGVYCKVEGLDSPETLRDYVIYRLECAGNEKRQIFTPAACRTLWKHSEGGVPRIINKLCKLSLKAGQTQELTEVGPEIVDAVAARFMRSYRRRGNPRAEGAQESV